MQVRSIVCRVDVNARPSFIFVSCFRLRLDEGHKKSTREIINSRGRVFAPLGVGS